jgi:hypothetical protein
MIYERGVAAEALNLNSTSYRDHDCCGALPLQWKIPTVEPGIEPGTSWLVVRNSEHPATRLVKLNAEMLKGILRLRGEFITHKHFQIFLLYFPLKLHFYLDNQCN